MISIKQIIFLISLLSLSLCIFFSFPVYAQEISDVKLNFNQYNLERELGYNGYNNIKYSISQSSGDLDILNFSIYDVNGNKLYSGISGTFSASNEQFPLKFVCENTGYQFSIELRIVDGTPPKEDIDYRPDLSALGEKLNSLYGALAKLDNFLSNPQPFYDSVRRLENTMNKISDYGPMGVAKDLKDTSFSPTGSDSLPSLDIEFIKGQGKVNVFDLSSLTREIGMIRNLMKAILYLGVVFFIMQSVVPQFKV